MHRLRWPPPARPVSWLELEITETALLQHDAPGQTALKRLQDLGVRIAMDDFGTSYASLSHLRSFPFDRLKIEQSFIAGMTESPEGRAAVAAILQLVVNPDIATIAEGVEIQQQLELPAAGRQVFAQAGSGVAGAEEWHAADGSQQSESSREGLTHQGHPFLTLDQNRYDAGVLGRRSDGNSVAGPAKPLNNASAIKLRLVRFDQIGIAWPDRSCAAVVTEVAGVIHCFR